MESMTADAAPQGESNRTVIALVDDDRNILTTVSIALQGEGFATRVYSDGEAALGALLSNPPDLAIFDIKMPKMDGMELLRRLREKSPLPVIFLTSKDDETDEEAGFEMGADDYIAKGRLQIDELEMRIARALRANKLESENRELRSQIDTKFGLENIIGQSPVMQEIFEIVQQVAPARASVLVLGESGTGKELVAGSIHSLSRRSDKNYIRLNCAAIPETLLESELFGHEKGAFTGALRTKFGRVEEADGGTIFLDEISELSLPLQSKLLRVLQEREFERVGGNRTIKVDVRVVAATNRKLEQSVEKKEFREDLYFRLNVIPLVLPPLRDRKGDIHILVDHFLIKHARINGREKPVITQEAMDMFMHYNWRGNVRELENVVERALLLCNGKEIMPHNLLMHSQTGQGSLNADLAAAVSLNVSSSGPPAALPSASNASALGIEVGMSMKEAEKKLIFETLRETKGNRTKAAQMLGISIRTLRNKLNEYKEQGEPVD